MTPDPVRTPLRRPPAAPMDSGPGLLLSTAEASKLLGISPNTLRSYVASGFITCRRIGPKLLKFDADEVARFAQRVSNA